MPIPVCSCLAIVSHRLVLACGKQEKLSSFEDKYTEALLRQQLRHQKGSPGKGAAGGSGRRSGSRAAAASPGSPDKATEVDDRVAHGYIFNPASGRTIKIGGDTFMRMLEAGWRPDFVKGCMVAPAAEAAMEAPAGGKGAVGRRR